MQPCAYGVTVVWSDDLGVSFSSDGNYLDDLEFVIFNAFYVGSDRRQIYSISNARKFELSLYNKSRDDNGWKQALKAC